MFILLHVNIEYTAEREQHLQEREQHLHSNLEHSIKSVHLSLARIRAAYPQSSSPSSSRSAAADAAGEQASEAVTGLTASAASKRLNWASALEWVSRPSVRPSSAPTTFPFNRRSARQGTVKSPLTHECVRPCVRELAGDGGASPRERTQDGPSVVRPSFHLCYAWRPALLHRRHGGREGKPITGELV